MHHDRELHELREEVKFLYELVKRLAEELAECRGHKRKLSFIKIAFGGIMPVGPFTLTVGATTVATVLGFDQNGNPMSIDFTANPVSWTDSAEAIVSDAPTATSDTLTGVSAGVMSLTATCAGFTDTETVTVPAVVPVLSSIKISIDAPPAAAKKA